MRYVIIFSFLILSACQKLEKNSVESRVDILSSDIKIEDLNKNKINELFVVLFKDNLSSDQWKSIFLDTQKLSLNKRKLFLIEGLDDEDSDQIRSTVIAENSVLLQRLSGFSVFILNWSLSDENCKFIFKDMMNLVCRPRNLDNPMNGGMPTQVGEISIIKPDPTVDEIKTDYLKFTLSMLEAPSYTIELRLKLESSSAKEFWFKGDVIPHDAHFNQNPFPYGYAELTTLRN